MNNRFFAYILISLIAGTFFSCQRELENNVVVLEVYGPSPAVRGDELRFIGKNLDQVTEIILPEAISVTDINKVSTSEIKIIIPEETVGGNYVILKTASSEIITKTKLMISEPIVITKVYKTGSTDNLEVIAGDEITIEGEYLNLVKEVIFMNNVVVSLNRQEGGNYSKEIIKVQVPIDAQTGEIIASTGSEIPLYITSRDVLKVALPEASSLSHTKVDPLAEITITGTNLHLVKYVKFTPELNVEIPASDNPFTPLNEIKVIVPEGTQTGKVVLIAYSGVETEVGTLEVTTPFISSSLPAKANINDKIELEGYNLDNVSAIFINNTKITVFDTQTPVLLSFTIPVGTKTGLSTVKIIDNEGKEYPLKDKIEITNVEPIKASDLMFMDFELHDEHDGSWDISWNGVTELITEEDNSYMRVSKAFGAEQWLVNCNHQDRGALIPVIDDVTQYVMKLDMKAERDFTVGTQNEFTFVVAGVWTAKSSVFLPLAEDGVTCTTNGGWITVTIPLSDFGFVSGSLDLSKKGDTGLYVKTDGMDPTGLCFDNWRFSKK